jgi:predicted dehydrogenase
MKFLIAGLGSIGQRHLRNLRALGQTDVLAYRQRNWPLPSELPVPSVGDLSAALAAGPDAVIVATPTSLHVPIALAVARAGCPLLIEKPLGHELEGIAELEALVAAKRLPVLVGYHLRFHPGLRLVKRLLDEGRIGRPIAARLQCGEYLPGWHPAEDYRAGYSARRDLGGGAILTLSHELDYAGWLFGDVRRVAAFAGRRSALQIDVEDTAQIALEFRSGLTAQVHLDYVQRPPARTCHIVGEAGQIFWDYFGPGVTLYEGARDAKETFPVHAGLERNDLYLSELAHFLECLAGRAEPAVPLASGRRTLEVALAARASADKGEFVWLP